MVFHQSSSYAEMRVLPAQCHAAEVLEDFFVHVQSKKHENMYSSQVFGSSEEICAISVLGSHSGTHRPSTTGSYPDRLATSNGSVYLLLGPFPLCIFFVGSHVALSSNVALHRNLLTLPSTNLHVPSHPHTHTPWGRPGL